MKRFFLSIIVSFSLLIPSASLASHAAGAQLRYEHLSGNLYRFHFTFFRDCSGIAPLTSHGINLISSCGDTMGYTVNLDSSVKVSQICAGESDNCTDISSLYIGIEAYYYHKDITLSSTCSLWTIGLYPLCNRNENFAITNLIPDTFCLYLETKLNNLDAPDNSSPVFTAPSLFQLCDQVQYLHFYAQDPDGDSLAFELYTPHSNNLSDVQYIAGCSATQPVTYSLPSDSTLFDPTTGDIRFKANGAQITLIGVRVNEFRNGMFIGSQEVDLKIIFNNCNSNSPIATGLNGSPFFTAHVCADSASEFEIQASDIDMDSIYFSWQNNIPGSVISLSGINNNTATFYWQPSASDISQDPYTFTIYVTDSICPFVNYNSYQYSIYVDSCFTIPVASFTSPQNVCAGSCISFTNLSTNASSYHWYFPGSIQDTSTLSDPAGICYPTAGNYDVQLIVSNSSGSDTLLLQGYITINPLPPAQVITQSGDSLFAIQGVVNYQWYYNNNPLPGATEYFYVAYVSGDYSVITTDSNGCVSEAVINNVIASLNQFYHDSNLDPSSRLKVFPNPVKDKFTIHSRWLSGSQFPIGIAPKGVLPTVAISIYNVLGDKIISGLESTRNTTEIDVTVLPSGLYYLELSSSENTIRTKFIKE